MMSWRMDSSAGAAVWDTAPLSESDLACRDEEIRWLMGQERQSWNLINGRIAEKGDPMANVGMYSGVAANPPPAAGANVPSLSGEASLFTTAFYTPWLALSLIAPSAWKLYVTWTTTTAATPGNLTLTPRVGSVAAGASSTGGITMGAGSPIALTASITTLWKYKGEITVRSVGPPGLNSSAYGTFDLIAKPATAGTGIATIFDLSGFTAATFDASVASGFVLGMVNTVTTIVYNVQQIHWVSV
jgi:hypothetical protein